MNLLTSIEKLKSHLSIKGATPDLDPYFQRVIAGASGLVQSMTGQEFGYRLDRAILNPPARAEPVLIVPAPVLSVSNLLVGGVVWPLVEFGSGLAGFALEQHRTYCAIHANNKVWPMEKRSIVIDFYAGFLQRQSGLIGAAPAPKVQSNSSVAAILSVTINGQAASLAAGAPLAGQYSGTAGELTFNDADAGKPYTWEYAGTPPDIELAILDIAATAYAARDRVGVTSKSLAGQESVSFSQDAVPPSAKATIRLYEAKFK